MDDISRGVSISHPGIVVMSCDVIMSLGLKVHYQIYSCALKYLMCCERVGRSDVREGGGEEKEGGGEEERIDEAAIAEVVGQCQQLPLGRAEYSEVRAWVRAVLKGHGRASQSRAAHSDEESQYGTTHPDEADAVSLLVQRIIADAEREVALETVANSEVAMETDTVFEQKQLSQSVIGTSHLIPQLPHSTIGPSQLHRARCSPPSSLPEATPTSLLEQCIYGVAVCCVRCPAYYKSLYRLASTLHSLGHSQASDPTPSPSLTPALSSVCAGGPQAALGPTPRASSAGTGQTAASVCAQTQHLCSQ